MSKNKKHPWTREYEETETGRQSDMTAARGEAGTSPFNPPSSGTKIEPARRQPPRSGDLAGLISAFEAQLKRTERGEIEGDQADDLIQMTPEFVEEVLLPELRLAEAELERARSIWRPGTLRR